MNIADIIGQAQQLTGKQVTAEGLIYHHPGSGKNVPPEWYMTGTMSLPSPESRLLILAPDPDSAARKIYEQAQHELAKKSPQLRQQAFEWTLKQRATFALPEEKIRALWYEVMAGSKEALIRLKTAGLLEAIYQGYHAPLLPVARDQMLCWQDFQSRRVIQGRRVPPYEVFTGSVTGTLAETIYHGQRTIALTGITELVITEGRYTRYLRNQPFEPVDIWPQQAVTPALDVIENPDRYHQQTAMVEGVLAHLNSELFILPSLPYIYLKQPQEMAIAILDKRIPVADDIERDIGGRYQGLYHVRMTGVIHRDKTGQFPAQLSDISGVFLQDARREAYLWQSDG